MPHCNISDKYCGKSTNKLGLPSRQTLNNIQQTRHMATHSIMKIRLCRNSTENEKYPERGKDTQKVYESIIQHNYTMHMYKEAKLGQNQYYFW